MHSDYALRMLITLGTQPGGMISVADIADAFGISRHHLIRVAQRLRDAGFVETVRGNGGGVRLARAPAAIRIGEVVRCTESDFHLVGCFAPGGFCRIQPGCGLRGALHEATEAFLGVLDRYALADLVADRARLRALLGLPEAATA